MSNEHTDLADSIRKVHQQLRHDVHQTPESIQSIWNAHISNIEKLDEYAKSMRQLAEHHWEDRNHRLTRIAWCYETIKAYFCDGLERKCARDKRKNITRDICENCHMRIKHGISKPRVLDVGSCYNPFSKYNDLETIAIDIAPADPSVHRIDFLRVPDPPLISTHSFDAIVFLLVLDYLPTCQQRLTACLNAHQLLTCLGLLLIAEPDSSLRENRQRSWRQALETIGFGFISYVKVPNMHFMAFRKITRSLNIDENQSKPISELFNIPQDTQSDDEIIDVEQRPTITVDQCLFDELPFSV